MGTGMAWGLLILSGLLDVAWAISVKMADGYSRLSWSILSFCLLAAFIYALGKALQVLPLGTAYAVWTGIGAIGSIVVGIVVFREPAAFIRLFWIAVTPQRDRWPQAHEQLSRGGTNHLNIKERPWPS